MPTWDNADYNWDDPRLTWGGAEITPWTEITEPDDIWTEVIQ